MNYYPIIVGGGVILFSSYSFFQNSFKNEDLEHLINLLHQLNKINSDFLKNSIALHSDSTLKAISGLNQLHENNIQILSQLINNQFLKVNLPLKEILRLLHFLVKSQKQESEGLEASGSGEEESDSLIDSLINHLSSSEDET